MQANRERPGSAKPLCCGDEEQSEPFSLKREKGFQFISPRNPGQPFSCEAGEGGAQRRMRARAYRAALGVLGEDLKAGKLRSPPSSALRDHSSGHGSSVANQPRRTTQTPAFDSYAKNCRSNGQRDKGW